ncbi:HNH endonuclease [Allobacillus sp. SKP2-8]|uniref:HNH endonuclease n=1 Tax=unclassified Allobacillus TaxID=2628859 RepID=UPI001183FD3E|nr:HNH endonuclease domain-containing protein [Allobacillus sp. SKP2-8]TSJ65131.1 HNH endonuclease [Allobacillus sp. SKP2-8]
MSHRLKVGVLEEVDLIDEDIWRVFTIILSNKSKKSSTYKYALMKSIIENLYQVNENYELTYDQLAYVFAKVYWNLVINHNLTNHNRGHPSSVVSALQGFKEKYSIPREFNFDKINHELQLKIVSKVKSIMKINVFGALYGDTKKQFYGFDHNREYFKLNPRVHEFMLTYQRLIVHLTNYHMARMIEQLNDIPDINYLIGKVESIAKRSSLKPYENILLHYFESTCFYCGRDLYKTKATHVDHFIPWSFVQSDHIWNLVLACNQCNTSKSDKLPDRQYLNFIIDRNEQLQEKVIENKQTLLENYKDKKIILLYDYSIKNGFDEIWVPRTF